MIRFACPGCGAVYAVEDAKAGKTGKCPKCQAQFLIPAPDPSAAPPPSSASNPAPPPLPPPPAPPADPHAPVEIAPCPQCQARLSVTAADLGADVECPYCKTVYRAKRPGEGRGSGRVPPPAARDDDRPSRRRRDDDEDAEDRPRRRRREEEDDDRPSRRPARDESDEPEEDRPRRRRRRDYAPHRGTTILILGILSLTLCGIFTGIPAVLMGNNDLKEMDAGRMDPEGRSTTNIGKILGLINLGLTVLALIFYCGAFIIAMAGGGAKGR